MQAMYFIPLKELKKQNWQKAKEAVLLFETARETAELLATQIQQVQIGEEITES